MVQIERETLEKMVFEGESHELENGGPDGKNPWELVKSRLSDTEDASTFVITDSSDSDGLGCATLLSHKFDNAVVLPASNRNWGFSPTKVMKEIYYETEVTEDDAVVYMTDFGQSPKSRDDWFIWVWKLVEKGYSVRIRDHHDNPESAVSELQELSAVEYVWDQSQCATMSVYENDYPDAPAHLRDFAELTDVRDMFRTDHPRFEESEILSNTAFWFPFNHYVKLAKEHGVNLTDDSEWGDYIENRSIIKERKLEIALERTYTTVEDGITYSFVYGECYQSEAGRRLLNNGCDIAVIGQPGGKISFRTADNYPIANVLADYFDGGGHSHAAGAGDVFNEAAFDRPCGRELASQIGPEIFCLAKNNSPTLSTST